MELQFKRPVMLGVALTNRPHVRLRNHPISINEEGQVRVPFMVQGQYKHPTGDMDFNQRVYEGFLDNHTKRVADFDLGADVKHLPELGAWLWFEEHLGGKVVSEIDPKTGDKLLVGYGWPTSDDIRSRIKNGQFRFASLEFHPNYRSNVKTTYLSSDFIDDVEESMSVSQEEFDALSQKNVKLESDNADLAQKIQQLTADLEALKAQLTAKDAPQEEQMTERELQLHTRLIQLEKNAVEQHVNLVIEKAKNRVNEQGQGLPAVILNAAQTLMLGKGMEGVVALEEADMTQAGAIADYFRKGVEKLLEIMPITAPRLEGQSQPDDTHQLESDTEDLYAQGKAVSGNFWQKRGGK